MMQNRKLRLALLTGLVLAPALAFAADSPPGRPDMPRGPAMRDGFTGPHDGFRGAMARDLAFSALDTNKDGKVSKQEFEANAPQRLKAADENHDGTVTRKEFVQYIEKRAKERADRMFDRMDTSGTGKLDLTRLADAQFDRMDRDGQGFLTKNELFPRPRMTAQEHRRPWGHRNFQHRRGPNQ